MECSTLDRRVLFLAGETKASLVEDDDAGMADWDFGDGNACDARCNAGDDIEASLRDGVV